MRDRAAANITVEPLTPDHHDDFLAFFDHESGPAFSDNPEWAKCYCQFYHTPPAVAWNERPGEPNREAMSQRIATGEMEGFLAYADAEGERTVVGWLNAQPRNKLPHCFARMRLEPTPIGLPDYRVAQVLCFVIHPQWRRRGIARRLLEAACETFRRRGIAMIEAYPFKSGDSEDPGDHYHGSLPMFVASGFEITGESATMTIVRKSLA
jgi:GNAT superfamily N-acetyltransferase